MTSRFNEAQEDIENTNLLLKQESQGRPFGKLVNHPGGGTGSADLPACRAITST